MFKVGQELLNYRFTALRHDIPQLFKTYLEVIGLNKLECGEPIASSHQAVTFKNISQKHPLVNIPRRLAKLTLWLGYGFERMPLPSNAFQVAFEKLIKALYDPRSQRTRRQTSLKLVSSQIPKQSLAVWQDALVGLSSNLQEVDKENDPNIADKINCLQDGIMPNDARDTFRNHHNELHICDEESMAMAEQA